MKSQYSITLSALLILSVTTGRASVVSTTLHGATSQELDSMIAGSDLIAGQIGLELAPLNGWHSANTIAADQLPAFTDGAGLLGSGLTGLLNDFPGAGAPAKTVQYSFAASDISSLSILTGNNGGDGRIFSTTVVRYSDNGGSTFNLLGYFQSDPSGTLNNSGSSPRYNSTMVSIFDDATPILMSGVTDIIFELYAVDNTAGEMRDPFDGVNPFTSIDDGLSAAFESPLVWELDVVAVPEPSTLALSALGLLAAWPVIRRRR
jgi:hypothetical protein